MHIILLTNPSRKSVADLYFYSVLQDSPYLIKISVNLWD